MRRFGRKLDVETRAAAVPLSLFCFDCLHVDGEDLIDRPTAERVARARGDRAGEPRRAAHRDRRPREASGSCERARPRARGIDGEVARRALRGRQPRRVVAQDQGRPHARPRRARGRMGQRPAPRWLSNLHLGARERRRLRDARQDVQRADRRAARVADASGSKRSRSIRARAATSCTCGRSSSSRSRSTSCR